MERAAFQRIYEKSRDAPGPAKEELLEIASSDKAKIAIERIIKSHRALIARVLRSNTGQPSDILQYSLNMEKLLALNLPIAGVAGALRPAAIESFRSLATGPAQRPSVASETATRPLQPTPPHSTPHPTLSSPTLVSMTHSQSKSVFASLTLVPDTPPVLPISTFASTEPIPLTLPIYLEARMSQVHSNTRSSQSTPHATTRRHHRNPRPHLAQSSTILAQSHSRGSCCPNKIHLPDPLMERRSQLHRTAVNHGQVTETCI